METLNIRIIKKRAYLLIMRECFEKNSNESVFVNQEEKIDNALGKSILE